MSISDYDWKDRGRMLYDSLKAAVEDAVEEDMAAPGSVLDFSGSDEETDALTQFICLGAAEKFLDKIYG
jgi:hypothetical protein